MTIDVVRSGLVAAIEAAVVGEDWLVTPRIPVNPDGKAIWIRFPNDARRFNLAGDLKYQIRATFCHSLVDPDLAQQTLDRVYDGELWAAIEGYDPDPLPWASIFVSNVDEPYPLELADGSEMLAVDLNIDVED